MTARGLPPRTCGYCDRPHHALGLCRAHYQHYRIHGTPDPLPDRRKLTTLPDLAALGITYRQLDYWTRVGYLRTVAEPTPGSGRRRTWPPEELAVARRMGRLIRAGFEVDAAALTARQGSHKIAPGIHVIIVDDEDDLP